MNSLILLSPKLVHVTDIYVFTHVLIRNIGGVHDKTMELTAKHDSGEVIGPNTFRAGFIDKAGPYASGWSAETLEEVLDRVDFFAEHGYIQIKLYSSIEPEWVAPNDES